MLYSISWSHFFIAAGIITAVYYAITFILLFSDEVKSLMKGASKPVESTGLESGSTNLLGHAHPEPTRAIKEEFISSETLDVVRSDQPEDPEFSSKSSDELLTGSVADLLDEIKLKLPGIAEWNKDEVFALIRELIMKYPMLKATVYQESINHFIANKCSDHFEWTVEPEEIGKLWS